MTDTNNLKNHKRLYIVTFGWPNVQVPHDNTEGFEDVKLFKKEGDRTPRRDRSNESIAVSPGSVLSP